MPFDLLNFLQKQKQNEIVEKLVKQQTPIRFYFDRLDENLRFNRELIDGPAFAFEISQYFCIESKCWIMYELAELAFYILFKKLKGRL